MDSKKPDMNIYNGRAPKPAVVESVLYGRGEWKDLALVAAETAAAEKAERRAKREVYTQTPIPLPEWDDD